MGDLAQSTTSSFLFSLRAPVWRGSCYFITPVPRLDDTYLNYHDSQLDFFFLVKWLRAQPPS